METITIRKDNTVTAANVNVESALTAKTIYYFSFTSTESWSVYDPGENNVGVDPDGYYGGVFDGRYLYAIPHHNGTGYHGEFLRYDTLTSFTEASSWTAYDPGANGVGVTPDGYNNGIFDGRYLYAIPRYNGTVYHGEFMRYDTFTSFTESSSWTAYDPGANGVNLITNGFVGCVFNGRYLYAIPYYNGTSPYGEFLRYDTLAPFMEASSWTVYDPSANSVGVTPVGFIGGVFDGRYLYAIPHHNGTDYHGEFLRYDTLASFTEASSWTAYDPGANGVGVTPDGYYGGVFDGRYLYAIPRYNGIDYHGEFMRYDTFTSFTESSSWTAYNPGTNGVGITANGYNGGVFDGRYLYAIPQYKGINHRGEFLRYDTLASFTEASSWTAYDPGANSINLTTNGFVGGVFDGHYLYAIPYYNGANYHGEFLRLHIKEPAHIPSTIYGGSFL